MSRVRGVCARQLTLGLLILGSIFCVPVSALAAGVITVNSPANGATVTVPFDVNFTYNASSTYTKLWIDGVVIISDHNSSGNLSSFDYTVTSLATGSHTLSLQAHDTSSNTTISVHETVTVSSTPPTTVNVTPSSWTMLEGTSYTFNSNISVNWSASGDGTIPTCTSGTTSCVFVAGASTGPATLTATSVANATQSATATITVNPPPVAGSTPVLTFHNDQFRSGANTTEVLLNTTNVNQNQFGLKYSYAVDGQIYAQPLYVPNLTINGSMHNVVFVATENNIVYAFDADGLSTSALWSRSLGKPHPVSGSSTGTPIYPTLGITSTPVIDPSTNTIYVFAVTTSGYQLSALDITSGQPRTGSPMTVTASVKGTGTGSSKGVLSLSTGCYQRPGLALTGGNVYIGFSYCHQGWLLAYDAATLQQKAVFCATPNGKGGGIWMSGAAPAVDSDGYIYVITSDNDGDPESIYEDAFLKLNPDLTVADYFQTSIDPTLIKNDADQGSGGIMILPDNSSSTPHEVIGGGKDGFIIVLNRDNLGKEHANDLAIQEVKTGVGQYSNIFSSPAFWNNTIYYHPENDTLHLFNYNSGTGLMATSPAKSGSAVYGWHGATPSISANGGSDGIVWEIEQTAWKTGGPAVLHAYDALSAAELYNSSQAGTRDTAGPAVRFTVPSVADGKVFVGTANQLDVYGLR
jgi:hypothetical protein